MPPEPTTIEPPVTPHAETPSPTMDAFDQTFADLDSPAAPTPEPTPEPAATPTPEPSGRPKDPETGKFVKAEPKPEPAKAPEKPVTEPPKPTGDFEPPQVAKPSELRNWAKRMGSRAETAEKTLTQLNHKVRELESRQPQQADTKALTEELANTKKRLEEYEGELKVTRYERSGEYKDKYEKPYQDAVRNAYADVGELLVTIPNPEDPENPRERQATPHDFDEVYQLPLGPATKLAKQKFGDAYTEVLKHRSAIKGATKAALEAIEQHKGKAAEFEQQQTAQAKMAQEGRSQMFGQAKDAIREKFPELFGEREGDTAWNENIRKGTHMADLAFSDRKSLTPEQSVVLDAQVYVRVSGYPALRSERDSLKTQLAARDKEIAELRGSAPGKGSPGAPKVETGTEHLSMEQAFDKYVPA